MSRVIQPSLIFATDGYVILCESCPAQVEGEDRQDAEAKAKGWTLTATEDLCPECQA